MIARKSLVYRVIQIVGGCILFAACVVTVSVLNVDIMKSNLQCVPQEEVIEEQKPETFTYTVMATYKDRITTESLTNLGASEECIQEFFKMYPDGLYLTNWTLLEQIRVLKSPLRKYLGWMRNKDLLYIYPLDYMVLSYTDLSNAYLENVSMIGTNLTKANLSGSVLTGVDFRGADLTDADLTYTDLRNVKLIQMDLMRIDKEHSIALLNEDGLGIISVEDPDFMYVPTMIADLTGAKLTGAKFNGSDLERAIVCGANLEGINLSYANLSNLNLGGINLSRADLYKANIQNSNLYGANLSYANLKWTDLRGTVLSYANLENADLSYAKMENTNIFGANLNSAKR